MEYQVVKWLHILSSTLLFGTGLGSAYYMFFTSLTRHSAADRDRGAAGGVGRLDLHQHDDRLPAVERPVPAAPDAVAVDDAVDPLDLRAVRARRRVLAAGRVAADPHAPHGRGAPRRRTLPLPPQYFRYLRIWTALGVPAFVALIIVFWLMVAKPS